MIALGFEPRSVWLQSLTVFHCIVSRKNILYAHLIGFSSLLQQDTQPEFRNEFPHSYGECFVSSLNFTNSPAFCFLHSLIQAVFSRGPGHRKLQESTCVSIPKDTNYIFNFFFWMSPDPGNLLETIFFLFHFFQHCKSIVFFLQRSSPSVTTGPLKGRWPRGTWRMLNIVIIREVQINEISPHIC